MSAVEALNDKALGRRQRGFEGSIGKEIDLESSIHQFIVFDDGQRLCQPLARAQQETFKKDQEDIISY